MSLLPENTKRLKLKQYNYGWSIIPGTIIPDVYTKGRSAGKVNANAGEINWHVNQTKFTGNLPTTAKHILDMILEHEICEISNEAELRQLLVDINESVQNFTQSFTLVDGKEYILESKINLKD